MKYDYAVIVDDLLIWFEKNKRDLPWRNTPTPYYVWVSEIMLQQTKVKTVIAYFERFIYALPDISALAQAPEEQLLKLWEGLGYYTRVRNLQKAAIIVVEKYQGKLPSDYAQLLKLPGIGSYTAGAIASIAYEIKEPAVDGNVMRVTKRVAGSFDEIGKLSVKKEIEEDLRNIMPKDKPGEFNQALMELGALVCLPNGRPLCNQCPIQRYCEAFKKNIVMELPVKAPKKTRNIQEKTILLLEYQNKYALHKRPGKGLLANLWELPNLEGKMNITKVENLMMESGIKDYEMKLLGEAKHIFTHIEWHMLGYKIQIMKNQEKEINQVAFLEEIIWVDRMELEKYYALPTAFSAYLKSKGDV
jgi:A/G-specific adenine glycosylase